MSELNNQVALITGGSRGIGKAIALKLASAGAHVAICGTNEGKLKESLSEIEVLGGSGSSYVTDVANSDAVKEMVKHLIMAKGQIDILVNNAGITRDSLLVRMSEDDWDRVLDINLKGTFNCTKAVLKPMMKARKGRIINIASVAGVSGNPGQANYAASKAGVIGFSKSVAREVGSRHINVNVVAPGYIQTDMTDVLSEKAKEAALQVIPLGSFGKTDDIASLILFLTSASSSYITGQVIHVDGGMVM
jgi:3-oxoacyl-[acyl-carrier protein] reductase